jgi:hypothetical protein
MDESRRAIEALGRAGIEAHHITLQGEAPDDASARSEVAEPDRRVMERWFALSTLWGIGGAVAGFILGIPVGALVIEVFNRDVTLTSLFVSASLGALFVGLIAWLTGAFYHVQAGEIWELSFHQTYAGGAVVGVHSADPKDIGRAARVLYEQGALAVKTVDPHTRPRDAVLAMTGRR